MNDRAQEVAEALIGTCDDLFEHAEPHELEDFSFEERLRDYALRCGTCGWWDEPEEMDTTGREPECGDCCGGT